MDGIYLHASRVACPMPNYLPIQNVLLIASPLSLEILVFVTTALSTSSLIQKTSCLQRRLEMNLKTYKVDNAVLISDVSDATTNNKK